MSTITEKQKNYLRHGEDVIPPREYRPLPQIGKQDIHPGALVHCPKFNFDLTVAASYCPDCEYWHGLALRCRGNPEQALQTGSRWDEVFASLCCYPMERPLVIVNIRK